VKILFVHQHLGALGGAESNIRITAEELQRRGHVSALIYERPTGRNESQWQAPFVECFRLPSGNVEHFEAVLEKFPPDLIYLHSVQDLDLVEMLFRAQRPIVRMVHDHGMYCLRGCKYNYFTRKICTRPASGYCVFPCLGSLGRRGPGAFGIEWRSYRQKQREIELNRRCREFIVYSEYCRRELVGNGFDPERIHIHVPIPTWAAGGPASSFSDRNLVLFAGQIIRGKGVDVLLRALRRVESPFECIVLGEGNHRRHCERLCARLGLSNRVQFRGYVPPAEMEAFYLEASVFAVSSLWPEPFGMVGPEAMRYGLPVVAFDAGGIREWLHDGVNGFLVPWMNTDLYAARIDQLLRDKTLGRDLGRRGQERVHAEYNTPRQVDRLEARFLRVISQWKAKLNENRSIHVVHGPCR
jgi:glycosyltransferase involved in cell wall biosynthesis